jgi:hypothetical protein
MVLTFLFPGVTVRFTIQRVFLFLLAPSFSVNLSAAMASRSASMMPEVRYHYGDDAAWANPNFYGSACALAPSGLFPITILSDGVVEAQSVGGELFGFDRTAAISTLSAVEIVKTAQQFGQGDDITVLTLTFTPAVVLHA